MTIDDIISYHEKRKEATKNEYWKLQHEKWRLLLLDMKSGIFTNTRIPEVELLEYHRQCAISHSNCARFGESLISYERISIISIALNSDNLNSSTLL